MTAIPDSMATHVRVENQFPEELFETRGRFIATHPSSDGQLCVLTNS